MLACAANPYRHGLRRTVRCERGQVSEVGKVDEWFHFWREWDRHVCSFLYISRQPVDQRGDVSCAKSVIDVDDADVRGARVEHAEQRGQALERGAIADAGGNGDDGYADEAPHHARQCTFHARAD